MSQANLVYIIGAVAKDPEFSSNNGFSSIRFAVSGEVKHGTRKKSFFQVIKAIGKEAQSLRELKGGDVVAIKGSVRHETWENDKGKQSTTYVKANSVRKVEGVTALEAQSAAGNTYFKTDEGSVFDVTVDGNIARVDMRYLDSGTAILSGSFACTDTWVVSGQPKEHTNWLNFTLWGDEAEKYAQMGIGRGWQVTIMGGFITNSTSKKDDRTYQNTNIEVGAGRVAFTSKSNAVAVPDSSDIDDFFSSNSPADQIDSLPF